MAEPLVVTAAEAGQKLVQYLQRRCGAPQSAIQRWVRTGQVRINGGRCKPFDRVGEGDVVRVPPFALADADGRNAAGPGRGPHGPDGEQTGPQGGGNGVVGKAGPSSLPQLPALPPPPPVVGRAEGLLVLLKPAGLAVQPGTGHDDCVTARLAAHHAGADFLPTPAHRLDRDTSGLLLVATSYARLRQLSDAFAAREGLVKEYLAWTTGRWPHEGPLTLHDRLEKQGEPGRQKVRRAAGADTDRTVSDTDVGRHASDTDVGRHASDTDVGRHASDTDVGRYASDTDLGRYASDTDLGRHASDTDVGRYASDTDLGRYASDTDVGRYAACTVTPLRRGNAASLLLVRLHTGRTHQIRVQLAERGHPIMGDRKYGGPACDQGMLLHAVRLTLPDGERFTALPDWTGRWVVGAEELR